MFNKKQKQAMAFALLKIIGFLVIIPILGLVIMVIVKGAPAISWAFLTSEIKTFEGQFGVMQAAIGTLYLMAGTIIFAVPVGILTAIYLTEYAKSGIITKIIRLAIINLAGVPSIVYGLFGFGLFVVTFQMGRSILTGSMILAIMTLPIIITSTEEALKTIPISFRSGSLALGATKWQTIWKVVLPNASSGIITGIILGIGRTAGETAPIIFIAAATMRGLPKSWNDQCMALPFQLYQWTQEGYGIAEENKWGTALVLMAIILILSAVAAIIRTNFRKKRTW